ncbi:MAG: FtsW/RodA/SpoVE family cell cycle protein [Oscillospiraceae bacterium]|nr:FtsW/RodA/SpoVE family cell cycle protein [Oscillospiraceae bacterium]
MEAFAAMLETSYGVLARYALPVLAAAILLRCFISLLKPVREKETWAYLELPDGQMIPITHWENTVGRASRADIRVDFPSISRAHAVITRTESGSWIISDTNSKSGIFVGGARITGPTVINYGDIFMLADVQMRLAPISEAERLAIAARPQVVYANPALNFFLLTVFQLMTAVQLLFSQDAADRNVMTLLVFCALAAGMWVYYFFIRLFDRTGFEVETIAFFLVTLGLSCTASSSPSALLKQLISVVMGIVVFLILGWFLRDLTRAKKTRWLMCAAAIGLFLLNIALGYTENGAKNWIDLGFITIQPSEFVKIAFIFFGASTLDRLVTRRNLLVFIIFTGFCVGALALVGDFGTASIFFVAFLVIAYMRSGSFATIALICTAAVFAISLMLRFKPYIATRFETWGHVWEYADTSGYQQTRTLMYGASGGLFGVGAGKGRLANVFAADTDLVFGMLCEEWGLIIAVMAVLSIACLALFTVRCAGSGRSSFFVIAACAAMSMFCFQTMLNVFGSTDILPLTGVTFPFVSNGGSSMMASWGLLAFVKAADTRPDASFAAKQKGGGDL